MKDFKVIINGIFALIVLVLIVIESLYIELNCIDLSIGVNIILTAISVIATIIFTYLIFIKERFSYYHQAINDQTTDLISIFILFVIGFIVALFDNIFISQLLYIVFTLLYIVFFVIKMCKKINNNEIDLLIAKISEKVDNNIQNTLQNDINDVRLLLRKVNTAYKFEYEKRNIIACTKIINSYSKFLDESLINRNDKIINNIDNQDDLFRLLTFFYSELIIKEKNDFSNKINLYIVTKYSKFINELVNCEASRAIDIAIDNLINIYKDNELYFNMDESVKILYLLICYMYEKNNINKFKEINKSIVGLLRYYLITSNDIKVRNLIFKYFSSLLSHLINEKNEYFDVILADLKNVLISRSMPKDSLYVISCLSSIIESKNFSNLSIKQDVYNLVLDTIKYNSLILNENFIQWLIIYINDDNIPNYKEKIQISVLICMKLLENNKDIPFLLIPDFSEKAQENINNDEFNYKCINTYKELLNKCFENKKVESLRYICGNIYYVLNVYQKQNQKEQEMWLKLYFSLLMDSLVVQDSTILESLMYYFRKSIFSLDKDRKISKQTSKYIIDSMCSLSYKYMIQNEKLTIMLLELFKEFLDTDNNFNFVHTNDEIHQLIYKQIYYIGVCAIERNSENVIKEISNLLGWKIKEKIEKKIQTYAALSIDYAIKLYELCYINCISIQTTVFVGTLFIIIGALCETDIHYTNYKKRIKTKIAKEQYKDLLLKSKIIRESAIDEWKNVLGNNPHDKIDKFWKYLYSE